MSPVFEFHEGDLPLLVSVPHDGRRLAASMTGRMTAAGCAIPDTDWHVAALYGFARDIGASTIVAQYSRYVVDLNRPADDTPLYPGQLSTGLCPSHTFAGERIYRDGEAVSTSERAERRDTYWRPYHEKIQSILDSLRSRFGYALLWDAHSIPSRVPRLFDGKLRLLNLGSNGGASAAAAIAAAVVESVNDVSTLVVDGRFKGGYITRHYGQPASNVHALQLEIAQRGYMDERSLAIDADRAAALAGQLKAMLEAFLASAARLYT